MSGSDERPATVLDDEQQRRAGLLLTVISLLLIVSLFALIAALSLRSDPAHPYLIGALLVVLLVLRLVGQRGQLRTASIGTVVALWLGLSFVLFRQGITSAAFPSFIVIFLVSVTLLGPRAVYLLAALASLTVLAVGLLQEHGLLQPAPVPVPARMALLVLQLLLGGALVASLGQQAARVLASALADRQRLAHLNVSMAARVQNQQTIAALSRRAMSASSMEDVVRDVLWEIRDTLGADAAALFQLFEDELHARAWVGESFAPAPVTVGDTSFEARAWAAAVPMVEQSSPGQTLTTLAAAQRNLCAVPLAGDGKRVGLIVVYLNRDQLIANEELSFVEAAGALVAAAIARAEHDASRAELNERLQRAQRLESLGLLAGGIAHDFNNLLTVITSCSDLMQQTNDPAERREYAAMVTEAAEQAADVTRRLLLFSRQDHGPTEPTDVGEVLRGLEGLLRRLLGERIRLEVRTGPSLPKALIGRRQLEQVLLNLAVNGRDAMPDGGPLGLVAEQRGDEIVIEVSDAGTGMSPTTQEHIFEPFFTTKPAGKGTGLGLAVVHGIVQGARGRVEVESALGRGSAFRVVLPVHQGPANPASVASAAAHTSLGGGETILLVEDEPQVRRIAAHSLRAAGFRVIEASGATEANAAFVAEAQRIDLLLTDVIMPGESGPELAAELRRARRDLPVLYISGYTRDELGKDGAAYDKIELLEKPFTPRALVERVRRVLDRRGG